MSCREGRVLRATSSRYQVLCRDQTIVTCRARRRLRRIDPSWPQFPVAGDWVEWLPVDHSEGGIIEAVRPRDSEIARTRSGHKHVVLANLDQLVAVVAVRNPNLDRGLLDRLLATAEHNEISVCIVFNKMDLASPGEFDEARRIYQDLGYSVLYTSAKFADGIEELRVALRDHISAFLGASGAGKSELITCLQPNLRLRTGMVNDKTGQGRHTTTRVDLHPTDFGAILADTPGVRQFSLWELDPAELDGLFVEFRDHAGNCYFSSCVHDQEPKCVIKEAVKKGAIDKGRYQSYLAILEELRTAQSQALSRGRRRKGE